MFQWENQGVDSVLRVGEALTKDKKSCARAFSSAVIIVARVRRDGGRRVTIGRDMVDEVTGRRSRDRRTQRAATPVSSSARDIQISNISPEKKREEEEEEEDATSTASLSGLYTRQGIGWPSPY